MARRAHRGGAGSRPEWFSDHSEIEHVITLLREDRRAHRQFEKLKSGVLPKLRELVDTTLEARGQTADRTGLNDFGVTLYYVGDLLARMRHAGDLRDRDLDWLEKQLKAAHLLKLEGDDVSMTKRRRQGAQKSAERRSQAVVVVHQDIRKKARALLDSGTSRREIAGIVARQSWGGRTYTARHIRQILRAQKRK